MKKKDIGNQSLEQVKKNGDQEKHSGAPERGYGDKKLYGPNRPST